MSGPGPVAVLGAGTMGRGIARVAAGAGHAVLLFDVDPDALANAESELGRYLDRDVEKARLTRADADAIASRIAYTNELDSVAGVGLVIEAIVENIVIKQDVLGQVESQIDATAIIATNTSSLSVTAIAGGLERPDRVAGMHFFNPAPVMPLVEIVAGAQSSDDTLTTLTDLAEAWGKTPVRTASTPGFIVNRVARPFYGEALRIVEEGLAAPAEVDAIVTEAGGFRMGPFAVMDLVGLDVNLAVSKSVFAQTHFDPRFAPNQLQQELVDAGHLGRKAGRGFYDYVSGREPEVRVVEPNESPTAVIVHEGGGALRPLVARLKSAGIATMSGFGPAPGIAIGDTLLWPSDGRPVCVVDSLVPDLAVVAIDSPLAWDTTTAVAVAGSDSESMRRAAGVLGAAGVAAHEVGDGPGLVLLRIMCQLASVAADAVLKGVASARDVDVAMRLGTNYPIGPLEWANAHGPVRVVAALDRMADFYGEPRYRPSALLRRWAATGTPLEDL